MTDTKININLENFNVDFKAKINNNFDTRYINPKWSPELTSAQLKYRNAEKLAEDIILHENSRYFAIIDGSFIFGDFIEALVVNNNLLVEQMLISTLSMSEDNIDSLANLLNGGFVQELNLIVSDYFYSHERHNLIQYAYDELDKDNKFQLAVASSHCKICIFASGSLKVVIHGSANLRSSSNIEQIVIEVNDDLYDFIHDYQMKIVNHYATIKKSIRDSKLWNTIT